MNKRKKFLGYIQSWKMRSLFVRNLGLLFLLVMVPLCAIVIISAFSIGISREREMQQTCINAAEEVKLKWERLQDEYDQVLSYIRYDLDVELFFYDERQERKFYSVSSLQKVAQIPVLAHRYVNNVFIYSDDIEYMVSTQGVSRRMYSMEKGILDSGSELSQEGVVASVGVDSSGTKCLLMHERFAVGKLTGIFLFKYNITLLLEHFNFQEPGDFYISDGTHILLSNRRELIGENVSVFDDYGDNYIRQSFVPENSKGHLVTVFLDKSSIQMAENVMIGTMVLTISVTFLVTLGLAFWISNKLYSPFRDILTLLQENEGFAEKNAFGSKDELEYIIHAIDAKRYFNEDAGQEMLKRLELLKKAQAVALQAQINPHFINNTLETISFVAVSHLGRDNDVSRMVKALASMLRSTLENVETLVPISEEIRHCEQYLSIQNIRYQGRFQTNWNIDPEVMDCRIIRVTLQPIVENAIYHGIKHLSRPGQLDISIRRIDDCLHISVRDNGLGMSEEKLRETMQRIEADMIQQSNHIGLANVYQRLKLFYGDGCTLEIRSKLAEGTEVSLSVPVK